MAILLLAGYTEFEVIPMDKIEKIFEELDKLNKDELNEFNERYIEYIENKGWLILSEQTLFEDWDNEQDDAYNDL
ncbi:hypothetical protein LSG31_09375 [Fodinisporobacter ferrooxydans]|uniref:Uncharacterized protein n=1 Tax=Fodinisporobacter ferrooxydans TaxID=2901836 RepID=A0ABY4CSW0_9BACL|nr:hypothetical protein LSG31_09375 [Alicyclobacillaceae bacterium MYW30-H2]